MCLECSGESRDGLRMKLQILQDIQSAVERDGWATRTKCLSVRVSQSSITLLPLYRSPEIILNSDKSLTNEEMRLVNWCPRWSFVLAALS